MVNPQIENGYTRLANQLFDEIILYKGLTGVDLKVILFVIRKTYGWNKLKTQLSYGDFSKACGVNRASVYKSITKLSSENIIFIQHTKSSKSSNIIGLNKNFQTWKNNIKWEASV